MTRPKFVASLLPVLRELPRGLVLVHVSVRVRVLLLLRRQVRPVEHEEPDGRGAAVLRGVVQGRPAIVALPLGVGALLLQQVLRLVQLAVARRIAQRVV